MKMRKTYLASILCLASATVSTSVIAGGEFEFHGYFRTGGIFDVEDSWTQYDGFPNKTGVGRLGIEETDFELELVKGWSFDDGKFVKLHTRLKSQTENFNDGRNVSNCSDANGNGVIDADECTTVNVSGGARLNNNGFTLSNGPTDLGFNEAWVEMGGINGDKDFVVWAGRRLYQRPENYSFIADLFYTDYTGTGVGFQGLALGGGKLEAAWVTSDRYYSHGFENQNGFDITDVLHTYHVGYEVGGFNTEFAYKTYPTNGETETTPDTNFAEDGWEISLMYSFQNFFGFANGFSKVVGQYGVDLSAGSLLGGSYTRLTSFRPLSAGQNFALNQRSDGDESVRLIAHGGWIGTNLMVFPHVMYEKTELDAGQEMDLKSVVIRPVFPMPSLPNFMVIVEAGHVVTENDFVQNGTPQEQNKVVVAPTFVMGTGEGPAPEIRLFVGHVGGDSTGNNTTIAGFQADLWW